MSFLSVYQARVSTLCAGRFCIPRPKSSLSFPSPFRAILTIVHLPFLSCFCPVHITGVGLCLTVGMFALRECGISVPLAGLMDLFMAFSLWFGLSYLRARGHWTSCQKHEMGRRKEWSRQAGFVAASFKSASVSHLFLWKSVICPTQ